VNTVFIGGSRKISRLPGEVKERLDNVVSNSISVVVGDANGADKAVQKYLLDASYRDVTVFCSGDNYRNNLGHWITHRVKASRSLKGFQFYAEKDREMARYADFGLMIWDGESPGTLLNVFRLVRAGKKAVLFNVPAKEFVTFKALTDWDDFISRCSADIRDSLHERMTSEEKMPLDQHSFLDAELDDKEMPTVSIQADDELAAHINTALAAGDSKAVVNTLGNIAKAKGMSAVARGAGLARESLYRALSNGGNPEFATVLKVVASLGLRLTVSKAS